MRTKALLGIAALAASALGASAANVYSLNVVGYINIPLVEGFNAVGNQLDLDGTGVNNTISGVFSSNLPLNSLVYTWTGTSWGNLSTYSGKTKTWSNDKPLNPGQGAFVQIPAGAFGGGASNVTIVGNVLQGHLVNAAINPAGGFTPVSSMVPLSGGMQTALGYVPQKGDQVYRFVPAAQNWGQLFTFSPKTGTWSPSEPSLNISEAVFLSATNAPNPAGWTQNFTVQ